MSKEKQFIDKFKRSELDQTTIIKIFNEIKNNYKLICSLISYQPLSEDVLRMIMNNLDIYKDNEIRYITGLIPTYQILSNNFINKYKDKLCMSSTISNQDVDENYLNFARNIGIDVDYLLLQKDINFLKCRVSNLEFEYLNDFLFGIILTNKNNNIAIYDNKLFEVKLGTETRYENRCRDRQFKFYSINEIKSRLNSSKISIYKDINLYFCKIYFKDLVSLTEGTTISFTPIAKLGRYFKILY